MSDGKIEDVEVEKIKNKIAVPGEEFDPSKVGQWTIPEKRKAQTIGPQPPPPPLKQTELPAYDPNAPKEELPMVNISKMPTLINPKTPQETPKGNPFVNIFNKIFKRGS